MQRDAAIKVPALGCVKGREQKKRELHYDYNMTIMIVIVLIHSVVLFCVRQEYLF